MPEIIHRIGSGLLSGLRAVAPGHPLDDHRDIRLNAALAASADPTRGLTASFWAGSPATLSSRPRRGA